MGDNNSNFYSLLQRSTLANIHWQYTTILRPTLPTGVDFQFPKPIKISASNEDLHVKMLHKKWPMVRRKAGCGYTEVRFR